MRLEEVSLTRTFFWGAIRSDFLNQLQPGNLKLAMRVCQPAVLDA